MHRLYVECEKDCIVQLESNSQIIPIFNKGAKINKLDDKENAKEKEIMKMIDQIHILGAKKKEETQIEPNVLPNVLPKKPNVLPKEPNVIPKKPNVLPKEPNVLPKKPNVLPKEPNVIPKKPNVLPKEPALAKKDCIDKNSFDFKNNSCYLDSVLFALFAFPTSFTKKYILEISKKDLLEKIRKQYPTFTKQEQTIYNYIETIQKILNKYNNKFQNGNSKTRTSEELRKELSSSILTFISNPKEKKWSNNNEEDASEFLKCILETFCIDDTLINKEVKQYTKNDKITSKVSTSEKIIGPMIDYNVNNIDNTENLMKSDETTKMTIDNEFYENTPKNFIDSKEAAILKRQKDIYIVFYYNFLLVTSFSENDANENNSNNSNSKNNSNNSNSKNNSNNSNSKNNSNKNNSNNNSYEFTVQDEYYELLEKYEDLNELFQMFYEPTSIHKNEKEYRKKINKLPANRESSFYVDLMKILYKDPELMENLKNSIENVKNDPKSYFYKTHQQHLKQIKEYYDGINYHSTYFMRKNGDGKIDDANQFIIFSLSRFDKNKNKNDKQIKITEYLETNDSLSFPLNSIVVHEGNSISSGHYVTYFRCNYNWYKYDNTSKTKISKIGTFKQLNTPSITKNAVLLFYHSSNPKI